MNRSRGLRALIVMVAAAIVVSACGADPDAISVGSQSISRDDLFELVGEDGPVADADRVAREASDWILFEAVEQYLVAEGEELTEADRSAARSALEAQREDLLAQGVTLEEAGAEVLAELDGPAGQALITRQAIISVATRYAESAAGEPDSADLPLVFCSRHILVDTEGEANDVLARLEGGEDFAALAVELSTDTGSGAAGGELGCVPEGQFVPEFQTAALEADAPEVVGPVQSQFGFHIIDVRSNGPATAENHPADADQVQALVSNADAVNAALEQLADNAVAAADVDVDASIGEYDVDSRQVIPNNVG